MKLNQELIDKVKQGTHCIEMPSTNPSKEDNYLLGKLAYELLEVTSQITRGYIYYRYKSGHLLGMVATDLIPIKISELSAFKTKMVSVEELKEWIEANYHINDNGYVSVDKDNLLNFLKDEGI